MNDQAVNILIKKFGTVRQLRKSYFSEPPVMRTTIDVIEVIEELFTKTNG